MTRSRLSKKLKRQSEKTLFLSILGIILVLFLLVKFGLPALINLSLFLSGTKKDQQAANNKSASFVSSPALDPLFDATNSAQINISGKTDSKGTVKLYVNGEFTDKTDTKDDNSFIFIDVTLKPGENTVRTKVITDSKDESDFSEEITVIYKKSAPFLSIDNPADGQSFSKDDNSTNITGKTDASAKVTVNGFWAIVDTDGKFSYDFKLNDGDNQIKVVATDEAGNTTEKEIKVKYSP